MIQAERGDSVRVHYTVKLSDGSVFTSSPHSSPLALTLGAGEVMKDLEQAIEGMSPGDTKSISVSAARAYGHRRPEWIFEIDVRTLPPGVDVLVGQEMYITPLNGSAVLAVVTEISSSTVTVDANHPLAGRDLIFDLELIDIV